MAPIKSFFLVLVALLPLAASEDTQQSSFSQVKPITTVITTDVVYTPAMFILGKDDGSILRCLHASPSSCELYHASNSAVTATLVHGEFLFAALKSGKMLRCRWERKHSCQEFHEAGGEITGLAVAVGHIHAGLRNGTVLRCSMNSPRSCLSFADLGSSVTSLVASASAIYAGSTNQRIYRCDTYEKNCSLVCTGPRDYDVTGLAVIGDKVFGLDSGGWILIYNVMSDKGVVPYGIVGSPYGGMAAYDGELYAVRKENQELRRNVPKEESGSSLFASSQGASSISFAYGTNAMQDKYRAESVKCIWKGVFACPPAVYYYDDLQHRASLEIFVKDGRLYDSQGVLLDTSGADEGYSQKAAIFVMGPDGQILVSNFHKRGLVHTSSLLAGSPASGAGLLVAARGQLISVTACSVHYRPDTALNDQVKQALRMKGYTDQIDFHPCTYNDMLCVHDGTKQL